MVYINDTTFELIFSLRDASVNPGATIFTQWIKKFTSKINGYLGVSTDICAYGDDTHESETIIDIISDLLEGMYQYQDLWKRTPTHERANIPFPKLTVDHKTALDELKGQDETIEATSFNFYNNVTSGGFD